MKRYVIVYRKETFCTDWNEFRVVAVIADEKIAKLVTDGYNSNPYSDPNYNFQYEGGTYSYEEVPFLA